MKIYINYKRSDFLYSPVIFYNIKENKTYLVSGNMNIEIPNGSDFQDIVYKSEDESLDDFLWEWFS